MGANHIALVDEGRMGNTVAVLDHATPNNFLITFDHKAIQMDEDKELQETKDEESAAEGEAETMEMHSLASLSAKIDALTSIVTALQNGAVATEDEEDEEKGDDEDDKEGDDEKKPTFDSAAILKMVNEESTKKAELLALAKQCHIGTFDSAAMSSIDVAKYAADKLKLTGDSETALRAYAKASAKVTATQDAKAEEVAPNQFRAGDFK
jgi:hypothetical protein